MCFQEFRNNRDNQYSIINLSGEIEQSQKNYYWEEREVYNHIAPIMERRMSKLQTVRPSINVFPASADERDIKTAKTTKGVDR